MKKMQDYFAMGLTAFLVIAASLLTGFLLFNYVKIIAFFKEVIRILAPFIVGLVIAYLVAPIYNLLRYFIRQLLVEKMKMKMEKAKKIGNWISITLSMLLALAILVGLFAMIVPGFIESILTIVNSMSTYINEIASWLNYVFRDNPEMVKSIQEYLNMGSEQFTTWLTETILPQLNNITGSVFSSFGNMVGGIFSIVVVVFNVLKNFIIGFIVAIYVLLAKTTMLGQCKKMVYGLFKTKTANNIVSEMRFINRVFGGFIRGKLIDSLIIGLMCFVFCAIVSMPYTLLVSVIIGVTNIIPVFGPFIGAVPCALLILLVSPKMCLVFVIFIIILQQLDGNVIGPKILGQSTGVSAFWVLFAIVVFGSAFGIVGMIIGVPVWAVISSLCDRYILKKLKKRELSTDLKDYEHLEYVVQDENGSFEYPKDYQQKQ